MSIIKDLIGYFSESKTISADEFIKEFEEKEEERLNSKEETFKRMGLDKLPCKLTSNDFNGVNSPDKTQRKYNEFINYIKMRERFEKEWE